MAFEMMWGTGFEMGHIDVIPASDRWGNVSIVGGAKTGSYCLNMSTSSVASAGADVDVDNSPNEFYVAFWCHPGTKYNRDQHSRLWVFTSGATVELRFRSSHNWDAYVGNSYVASGSVKISNNDWHHIQFYVSLDDTNGIIQTKIEGIDDIDYTGNVGGSGATVTKVRLNNTSGSTGNNQWDNLCFGTGGWPGDIRFEALVPDGDHSVEWTPSTGLDNYDLVNNIPPDAPYVESDTDGDKDIYTLADWDGTDKIPKSVVLWGRAYKTEAEAHQIRLVLDDGGTEDIGDAEDLGVDIIQYRNKVFNSRLATGAWTAEAINALKAGVQSVIASP